MQRCKNKKTICRSFEFFHNKIIGSCNADYWALGFFDYFQTNVINIESLESLYENTFNISNVRICQSQKMYGFCESNSKESIFWNLANDKPIFIISFLYFDKFSEKIYQEVFDYIKQNKEKCTQFQLYYTLDKADLILCVKSNSYINAVQCIESLYNHSFKKNTEAQLVYTYSHLVIKKDNIDKAEIKDELIDSICIKATVNNYPIIESLDVNQKISFFCSMLAKELYLDPCSSDEKDAIDAIQNKELVGYEILGETDCRIIARNVNLKKLIMLYNDENLLNFNNPYYQVCFTSTMTSLNIKKCNNFEYITLKEMIDKKNINTKPSLEQKYLKNCEEMCSKIDQLIPYKKTLCVIANYIDYMCCNQYIQDYERKFLENAFNVLLTIFQEYFNKTYTDLINYQEIGDYINSIYAIIQSNWYSDFRAIQMVDFSVVPYYSPVKIRYYYTYLVDQFSTYYKFLGAEDKKGSITK